MEISYLHPLISDKQRDNYERLATYLEAIPPTYTHFRMEVFCGEPQEGLGGDLNPATAYVEDDLMPRDQWNYFVEPDTVCGTVACALGHAPLAGIAPNEDEDWWDYGRRCFGARGSFNFADDPYFFCFSPCWSSTDDTPHGAAKRIRLMLDKGLPFITGCEGQPTVATRLALLFKLYSDPDNEALTNEHTTG